MKIPFVKMHGLGNDFVIIAEDALPKLIDVSAFAMLVADRRYGIGCDQFITYKYDDKLNVQMGIYNQDGSKALACGNATRCLSRLVFDLTQEKNITVHIGDRKVACQYISPDEIKVDLGTAGFDEKWMPNSSALWKIAERHSIEPKEMLCVDVANPHLVIFSRLSDQDRAIIGQNFQNIDLFKGGINVNFAKVEDDKIYLQVWERGVGFTCACGSGAVATFAAANKLGFSGEQAEIVFDSGSLKMQKEGDNIVMHGPASYVFSGDFLYD